jgi:hypothetical protein
MDFKDFFGSIPLGSKMWLMTAMLEMMADDMRDVINKPYIPKANLTALGLRQCAKAGEGDSDLRVTINKMKEIVRVMHDDLLFEVEIKAANAI